MTFPVVYQSARTPSAGPTPGAKALMAWTIEHFGATSLGIYNNRSVRGGTALSLHAEGRAGDSGYPYTVGGTPEGWVLANWLVENHEALGVQAVIYSRRQWSSPRASQGWRYYSGQSAHYEHVHWELTRQAAAELTTEIIEQSTGDDDEMALAKFMTQSLAMARLQQVCLKHRDDEMTITDRRWLESDVSARIADGRSIDELIDWWDAALYTEGT